MEGGLDQTDSGSAPLARSVHRGLHELTSDTEVLYAWVDCDRANASNHGAFVEAVAANDPAIVFGNDAVEAGARKPHGKHTDGSFRVGKIAGKAVGRTDRGEGFETDLSGDEAVLRCGGPNYDVRPLLLRHVLVPFECSERSVPTAPHGVLFGAKSRKEKG